MQGLSYSEESEVQSADETTIVVFHRNRGTRPLEEQNSLFWNSAQES